MNGFSSAIIQILALITMTVDHVGLYLMDDFQPYRAVGRMAMPLFAFMLVEGFMKTRSRPKYFLRILLCALVAEVPLWLLHVIFGFSSSLNLLFGFLVAFILMALLEKSWWWLVLVPILALGVEVLGVDYGGSLILLIGAFYAAKRCFPKHPMAQKAIQTIGLVASTAFYCSLGGSLSQFWSLLALIPIWLYDGSRGKRLPRIFSYAYYPAHLLVIFLLMLILFR